MRSDAIWGLGCEQRRFCCLGCSWSGRAGGGVPEFGQEGFYAGDGNVKFPSSSPPPAIPDCRSVRIGPERGKLNAKWDLGNVASFAETDVWELGGKSCLGGGPAEFLIPPPAPQFRHARHVWIFFFFGPIRGLSVSWVLWVTDRVLASEEAGFLSAPSTPAP